ncbi:MAG: WG repeat-containing protein [Saprospirales bacterium]|nr:WG repeat-containing protein [Saprospirales bacterium]
MRISINKKEETNMDLLIKMKIKRLILNMIAYSGFSEGLAAVELNGKWGFIDENGNRVIPSFKFDEVNSFSNGLAWC